METLLGITTVFFAIVAGLLYWRMSAIKPAGAVASGSEKPALEDKAESLKKELAAAKEEIGRKQKQLEEAREEAKKKLRREGKKLEREEEEKASGTDPRDVEIQGLKKGMAALESQLNTAKRDVERMTNETDRVRGDAKNETEGAQKAREDERSRNRSLADENAALKKTLDELRSAKRKENERPDVPGSGLDLKALPADAVQELARYFRKGEEFERLFHVTSGQLQLEKDRYQELQRRYFAVCRELALAAGQKPSSDADAKSAAEGLVAGSDQVARSASTSAAPGGAPASATAAPGAPGDPTKKRRRRRRKKKPGAQGTLPGTDAGGAAAAGADGADGADGDDFEGDEGGDDAEGDDHAEETAPPAPAPETGSAPAA